MFYSDMEYFIKLFCQSKLGLRSTTKNLLFTTNGDESVFPKSFICQSTFNIKCIKSKNYFIVLLFLVKYYVFEFPPTADRKEAKTERSLNTT